VCKLKQIVCPDCEGEGVVWVLDWLSYNGDQWDHEEQCSRCFGEGTILVDDVPTYHKDPATGKYVLDDPDYEYDEEEE